MKTGDQVICTYDYVTHDGRKLFSVGDITTIKSTSCKDTRFNDKCWINLKDSEESISMEILADTHIVDYCGNEYFQLHITTEQQKPQVIIPEDTQHLLINSIIKHPLNLVCDSNCGEFDLDFALREYCRMGKIILDNAVKHNYDKSYDNQHLVKTFDNLRFSLLSYYTMIINNAYESMVLDEYYIFYKKLREHIINLSNIYTENFDGAVLNTDIIFCLSSTNFQLEERRLNRIKESLGIKEVTAERRAELLSMVQNEVYKSNKLTQGTVEQIIHPVHPFYPKVTQEQAHDIIRSADLYPY